MFQEVLSLTEFELMQLLDVGLAEVASAVARISEIACPPYQTVSNGAYNSSFFFSLFFLMKIFVGFLELW